ncbi:hypothetical protein [Herpetosiphon llansteffanensis]|uniref:hypothetical protein n=1 Tax=Herpetosiphon llansteffanensis TaxID=2094568 RepID=UPI001F0BF987|nr:hypothetical protein [Herpetosiphon llansteffanensis]
MMQVFRPFLQPPTTIVSVPALGGLSIGDLVTLGGCGIAMSVVLAPIGLPLLVRLLVGVVLGLVVARGTYQEQPLRGLVFGMLRYGLVRLLAPQRLTVDCRTLGQGEATGRTTTTAVMQPDGTLVSLADRGLE